MEILKGILIGASLALFLGVALVADTNPQRAVSFAVIGVVLLAACSGIMLWERGQNSSSL